MVQRHSFLKATAKEVTNMVHRHAFLNATAKEVTNMARHVSPTLISRRRLAFTLIELLIVIAIIAILALIAIPNFLEAQVRAKVSKARTDMRSIATALEAYYVDYNNYPVNLEYADDTDYRMFSYGWLAQFDGLTTPIAYISSYYIMQDPFKIRRTGTYKQNLDYSYEYCNIRCLWQYIGYTVTTYLWGLRSIGPDRVWGPNPHNPDPAYASVWLLCRFTPQDPGTLWYYDPTNGTTSGGDIIRMGP